MGDEDSSDNGLMQGDDDLSTDDKGEVLEQNEEEEEIEEQEEEIDEEESSDKDSDPPQKMQYNKTKKVLKVSKKEYKRAVSTKAKVGIVYLSRIPTYFTPSRIRRYFSQFGELGRVFLRREDNASRKRRYRSGGGRSKKYLDGWVEF
eukprot:TRINITY_DN6902_c0_g1_i1.p1 TRINITY_DN6902_c0_g1~~TRINITY_DN6902_c0_g1_i1.p1  ORF type:complete len:147 (+),score=47.06 TRINITY_DN6902_c0_g1_i1:66-506(+)